MTDRLYVVVDEDELPFSAQALEACSIKSGDRVDSFDLLERLMHAEHAALEASHTICRARIAVLLGGK